MTSEERVIQSSLAPAHRTELLLVEGDDAEAERLHAILEDAAPGGFDVTRVVTVAEAFSFLTGTTAECVVVDLGPGDTAAIGVVEALADHPPQVVLIALTGRDDDELGLAAVRAGASDYLFTHDLEGAFLVRSIRHAIVRKHVETSLADAQRISRVGSWEADLATDSVRWSRELYRLFAFSLDEKPTYRALLDRIHPDDREATEQAFRATVEGLDPFMVEHRARLPDGSVRWIRSRGRIELGADGRPERLLGTAQDIMEQKTAEEALLHQALHEPLSGLPNRLLLVDRLSQALLRLGRQFSTVGVIHIDVDRFKVINDSLGHPVGDQLLVGMATRLSTLVRPGDTLARVGGDDFVVLCEGLSGEAEAVSIAGRICDSMAEPLPWHGGELVLSVTAGIAVASTTSANAESLLRDADAAMYWAKRQGARLVVFADTMRTKAIGRLDTEVSLRTSILDGDLRVHYQPIVTLADGQVLGYEALVRWQHPTRGLLGPDQFITIAEETGLIVPLGAWVLREACLQAKRFQGRDPRWARLTMSVNLSGAQLGQPGLVELVASALHDADLKPEHLQLEMTESVLMDDAATTITILQALKGLGVRLGVDDFGTGYSSLAYLRRFPVEVLKIDRSFIDGLGKDLEDSAVAAAIVSLADTLGLTAIAEGVETALQRDCLVGLGCSLAQGYLFSRPVTAADAEAALDLAAARPRNLQEALGGSAADAAAAPSSPALLSGQGAHPES